MIQRYTRDFEGFECAERSKDGFLVPGLKPFFDGFSESKVESK